MIDRYYERNSPVIDKVDDDIYGSVPTLFNYFFMPSGKFDGFLNKSLGGNGLPLTSFDEPFKKAWSNTRNVREMSTNYSNRDPNPLVLENWRE